MVRKIQFEKTCGVIASLFFSLLFLCNRSSGLLTQCVAESLVAPVFFLTNTLGIIAIVTKLTSVSGRQLHSSQTWHLQGQVRTRFQRSYFTELILESLFKKLTLRNSDFGLVWLISSRYNCDSVKTLDVVSIAWHFVLFMTDNATINFSMLRIALIST